MEAAREARRLERQRHARRRHAIETTALRTVRLEEAAARLQPSTSPLRRGLGALLGSRPWDAAVRAAKAGLGRGRPTEPGGDELERRRRALDRAARRLGAYETGGSQLRRALRRSRGRGDGKTQAPPGPTKPAPTRARAACPALALRIASPDLAAAIRGGDYHLARALAAALEHRGLRTAIETDADGDGRGESRIVLRGRHAVPPRASGVDLLWLISHPDRVTDEELAGYDGVLVASAPHAATLADRTDIPLEFVPQFADPQFTTANGGQTSERHDLLFVGNWRGEYRRIVWDAHCLGRHPALVGDGWRYLAPAETIADHVPYAELPDLYGSARILLVDHWDDMRKRGFVSNRVFDALASGVFVIADDVAGLSDLLPGGLVTYRSLEHLERLLAEYLVAPAERRRVAERGRALVLAAHTAERRVDQLLAAIGRATA